MVSLEVRLVEKCVAVYRAGLKGLDPEKLRTTNGLMKTFDCRKNKFYSDVFDIADIEGFLVELEKIELPGIRVIRISREQERKERLEKLNAGRKDTPSCPDCGRPMEKDTGAVYCEYCEG